MKKLLALLIVSLFSLNLMASEINWNRFEEAFSNEAEYQETYYGIYAVLQDITPIENGHIANYFSGVGGFDDNGTFMSYRYELVSEEWRMIDGLWHIDQWLLSMNSNKKPINTLHRTMIQTEDRVVLDISNVPETEEAYQAKIQELLKDWMRRLER